MRTILTRIFALFIYNAIAVIGGASLLGGIEVWKAAVLAGVASVLPVAQKLAKSYLVDGKLTAGEADEAFGN